MLRRYVFNSPELYQQDIPQKYSGVDLGCGIERKSLQRQLVRRIVLDCQELTVKKYSMTSRHK